MELHNTFGGPIYANGDCVPWRGQCVDIVDVLWIPVGVAVRDECRKLYGNLEAWRTKGQGHGWLDERFF